MSFRVLSNVALPELEGFVVHSYADYPSTSGLVIAPELDRRTLSEILAKIPSQEKPDLFVFKTPEYLPLPDDIESFDGPKVLLITDWNVCLRFLPDICPLFDFCFTDFLGVEVLRKAGINNVFHMPLFGFDPSRFFDMGLDRDLDISFCGNFNPSLQVERNRLVYRLSKLAQDCSLFIGNVFDKEYVEVLNRSKLVFNYAIRKEANMRVYEAMACGAVVLVESGNLEVPLLFNEGEHYLCYDPNHLERDIQYFLTQPELLQRIAMAARSEVMKHTLARQMQLVYESVLDLPRRAGISTVKALKSEQAERSLIKLRILGRGYTLADAFEETRIKSHQHPELIWEVMPALLLDAMTVNASMGEDCSNFYTVLCNSFKDVNIPVYIRYYHALRADIILERWDSALVHAALALERLDDWFGQPESKTNDPGYTYFYTPIGLGRSFNTDLNIARSQDMQSGNFLAFKHLFRSNILQFKARAHLAKGDWQECVLAAEAIGANSYTSLSVPGIMVHAYIAGVEVEGLKIMAKEWVASNPMDIQVWEKLMDGFYRCGCLDELMALFDEIVRLDQAFSFSEDWRQRFLGLMDKYRQKIMPPSTSSVVTR